MYYIETPSDDLIDRVRAAIQVNIIPWDRKFWFDFFVKEGFELLYYEDYKFNRIDESEVKEFSKELLEQPHLNELSKEAKECLHKKYTDYMLIFRENLSHMGYSIIYLRKTEFIKIENFLHQPQFLAVVITKLYNMNLSAKKIKRRIVYSVYNTSFRHR